MTNNEQQREAFDAIHDEAVKALNSEDIKLIKEKLNLIISLARYKFDNR